MNGFVIAFISANSFRQSLKGSTELLKGSLNQESYCPVINYQMKNQKIINKIRRKLSKWINPDRTNTKENKFFSKIPIGDWNYGEEWEHFVIGMSLSDIVSLEDKYFISDMTNSYDNLYYSLLDHKELRKKFVEYKRSKKDKSLNFLAHLNRGL